MGYKTSVTATFVEPRPTKNPKWIQLRFIVAEIYKGTEIEPVLPNLNITIQAVQLASHGLLPGQHYDLDLDTSVQQPSGEYAARLNFSLLSCAPVYSHAVA